MSEDFGINENPVKSFLFQCNLFRLVLNNTAALCLVCKKQGFNNILKGRTTSNYHNHMKRTHPNEYQQYLEVKKTGIPKILVPIYEEDHQVSDEDIEPSPHVSPLFEFGFFEIRVRLENKIIKANCMTCQRMGRSNLILAREFSSSNLLAHLKRMHPAEYERYLSLKAGQSQKPATSQAELDVQQSVVSTIKSEDLEFVEVNQDEIPGETWDSFDSDEYYDHSDTAQPHTESAATSTTKTIKFKSEMSDPTYDSGTFNDIVDAASSNDDVNECPEYNPLPASLVIRGGFFQLLRRDGVSIRAKCLNCNFVYSGHMRSSSNFIRHLRRMHPLNYQRFLDMKEKEKQNPGQSFESQANAQLEQSDFNQIVLKFMINGMHHPNLLKDPSFATLLNEIASKGKSYDSSQSDYHIVSPQVLMAEVGEQLSAHKENLLTTLSAALSVSMAIDVWSVNKKTFLLTSVNWVDATDYRRISDVISCDVFDESISNDLLLKRFHEVCTENGIADKIVAVVTNNNRQYDRNRRTDGVTFRDLDTFDHHIKNSANLFELIGTKGFNSALNDEAYAELHKMAFGKFDALHEVANGDQKPSEAAESFFNSVFKQPAIGSKVSEIYNCISNLVNCESDALNQFCPEFDIPTFTEMDWNFFKEYAIVMEPIATAIEYLQRNQCYYATLLPMVYSMRDNLMDVQRQGQIQLCKSLLEAVLSGVERIFEHLFDFSNEKCIPAMIATCTHPFFKMRWLKGDMKTPINTSRILDVLVKAAKEHDNRTKTERIDRESTYSDEQKLPEKKFKFSFDTSSNKESDDETMIQMDFMSFLKKPCQNDESNLDELKHHPWVQKLFIRYNSIVVSAAAFERWIPLHDLIDKSQFGQFDDDLFCKLALLRTNKM